MGWSVTDTYSKADVAVTGFNFLSTEHIARPL